MEENNKTNDVTSVQEISDIEKSDVDKILADKELVNIILAEKGIQLPHTEDGKRPRVNQEALTGVAMTLVFFVLGLFIVSPFLQLICRMIEGATNSSWTPGEVEWIDSRIFVRNYQHMIRNINMMVGFTALFIYLISIYKIIVARKKILKNWKRYISAALPFIIFVLFVVSIIVVTRIRGYNEYDKSGHPYMYESIYSYMLYPLAYFFCGMFVWKSSYKKILLYAFIFTAFPLSVLALWNEWVHPFKYFLGNGVTTVFHNSNHYGYYLALVIFTSAILFVIEKKLWRKIVSFISMCFATIVLQLNNTLGAFLAVAFAMLLFLLYSIVMNYKAHKAGRCEKMSFLRSFFRAGSWQQALLVLVVFLGITLFMSMFYNTIITSVVTIGSDVGDILSDPMENDRAGSGRWCLWKGAAKYIVKEPWLGYGVEGLLNTHQIGTPHNELLQYAEFFGVITTFLYVLAIWFVMWRIFRYGRHLSMSTLLCFFVSITYLASSFFGVAIYYTTPFIYIFLGLTYAEFFHYKCNDTLGTEVLPQKNQ